MAQTKIKVNPELSSPITILEGLGPKKSESFAKLGVFTLEDLFYFMPRRYEDRRFPRKLDALIPGKTECVIAKVDEIRYGNGRTEAVLVDDSGTANILWFSEKIGSFVKKGMKLAVYGTISEQNIIPTFTHPEFEILRYNKKPELIGKIFAVYPGTADLTQRAIRKFIDIALENYADVCLKEFLPQRIFKKYGMMNLKQAITQIHRPTDELSFIKARNRLAFEEFYLLQTGIIMRRNSSISESFSNIIKPGKKFNEFMKNLPFSLTRSQQTASKEILEDMNKSEPMNRLLQGDVGSGKTIIAVIAMIAACDSKTQSAFMAPTEILAQQHYMKLKKYLEPLGINIKLLTGSLREKEKRKILDGLFSGSIDIVVGTHAIFSDKVEFMNLSLVIVDEQHRFGVLQRSALISKGKSPHVLAMTATPIPRTLILSVYGDLGVSVLKDLPAGRKKIKTIALKPAEFRKAIKIIREHAAKNEQIYWVCPLIDDGERDLASVNAVHERLSNLMPDLRIEIIHGKLPVNQKIEIMNEFAQGKINILVATVIIEVGVDVPNASLIVIEDAGQFGLAQLHQLRGRVGRGNAQSMCILLENEDITVEGLERVNAMVECADGFELAEYDLRLRGAGEICGTRQHGVTNFRAGDLLRDEKILLLARDEARELLNQDSNLDFEPLLKHEILRRLGEVLELAKTS